MTKKQTSKLQSIFKRADRLIVWFDGSIVRMSDGRIVVWMDADDYQQHFESLVASHASVTQTMDLSKILGDELDNSIRDCVPAKKTVFSREATPHKTCNVVVSSKGLVLVDKTVLEAVEAFTADITADDVWFTSGRNKPLWIATPNQDHGAFVLPVMLNKERLIGELKDIASHIK